MRAIDADRAADVLYISGLIIGGADGEVMIATSRKLKDERVFPTVQRRSGIWAARRYRNGRAYDICSECEKNTDVTERNESYEFCPNCGASMIGGNKYDGR